jgi:hypothetical protein
MDLRICTRPCVSVERERIELGWPKKFPIVSLLLATAIAGVPFMLTHEQGQSGTRYEAAREEARSFLVRNPELSVDTAGSLILDPEWLAEMRATAAEMEANSGTRMDLPARMMNRSQARLDEYIFAAYEFRLTSDPAWQYGVLDARTPTPNYFIHAFVQPSKIGIALTIAVLLFAGIALEMTWGSLIFATFLIAAIPLTAESYRILDASSGVPWSGAAGLAGALLGAYFIRGLGGHFTIPGWILMPLWLGMEAFVVRGFWIDHLGSVPWATFCASVGIGALSAGGLRLTGFDPWIAPRRENQGPNSIVSRAARMRSDGDPYQAFDLIQAAWREDPGCSEIAEAFFSIAVEVDQPEAAAEAIVPSLHRALRKGEIAHAVDYWFPLAAKECDVRLDPAAAVKLGEALLDAGHPKEAIFTFRSAIDIGVSAVHAARIVRIARDLDEPLARQAAAIAIADSSLDANLRAELELILADSHDSPHETGNTPPELEVESRSQLDRRISAEHHAVEPTTFPIEADEDSLPMDSNESRLAAQALDAGAFSLESLSSTDSTLDGEGEAEPGAPAPIADIVEGWRDAPRQGSIETDDILSHWDESDSLSNTAVLASTDKLGETVAISRGYTNEDTLDASALESSESGFNFGSSASGSDYFRVQADETDSDLTPIIDVGADATGELTNPLVSDETVVPIESPSADSPSAVFDQPTMFFDVAATAVMPPSTDATRSLGHVALWTLKSLEAVPISVGADWIEIDASPKGKSKLPFARIQTLSMAAIDGLGTKPILVVDCILTASEAVAANDRAGRSAETSEVMKSIRFRSDRFDPRQFAPDAPTPLAALTAWVNRLQAGSNANCLPSREILNGTFQRFSSIEAYEHEVLGASREDES